jgi:Zn-dependent protease
MRLEALCRTQARPLSLPLARNPDEILESETPVSPDRLRGNPRTSMAIVAVAGPAANLLMALVLALPVFLGLVSPTPNGEIMPSLFGFLFIGIQINLLLMVFNLMPIPPLDGFTILLG